MTAAMPQFTSQPAEKYKNPLAGLKFRLDGIEFACEGDVTTLDVSELATLAVAGEDSRSPASVAMLSQFLSFVLGPEQYIRLKQHVREHRTDDETLLAIVDMINEHTGLYAQRETGRPTSTSSRSSDGPAGTADRISRVISLQTGDVQVVSDEPAGKATGRRGGGTTRKTTAS